MCFCVYSVIYNLSPPRFAILLILQYITISGATQTTLTNHVEERK